jgi:catechol 2,3-dioxygenase-like lactoylglutathione lyase family enzyme
MIDVLGIDHIDLTVRDQAASIAFYEKVLGALGFRRISWEGTEHDVNWANAHVSIGIYEAAREEKHVAHTRRRAGFHHLALRARTREDVDRFHEFLVREGITILDPPAEYPQYGRDYYAVFFADPDGMKLELVHFPWGYWRKVMTEGRDDRPRYAKA